MNKSLMRNLLIGAAIAGVPVAGGTYLYWLRSEPQLLIHYCWDRVTRSLATPSTARMISALVFRKGDADAPTLSTLRFVVDSEERASQETGIELSQEAKLAQESKRRAISRLAGLGSIEISFDAQNRMSALIRDHAVCTFSESSDQKSELLSLHLENHDLLKDGDPL